MKGIKKKNKINKKNARLNKKRKRTNIKSNNNSKIKKKENDLKKNKLKFFHPINISYFDTIITDCFPVYNTYNTFIVFNSVDNVLTLIYRTEENSIISYDIFNNKKLIEIKKAHDKEIINFRHYFDSINKRDIVISLSTDDDTIKLWNSATWECISNISGIYRSGILTSACIFSENNQNYILTSTDSKTNLIKIIDFTGKKIKFINDSKNKTYFIDYYYDNSLSKPFVITGNDFFIESFDYKKNEKYHTYYDKNHDNFQHERIIIYNSDKITKIIESTLIDGIKIWDFHSGKMLQTIFEPLGLGGKYDICLWNNDYLFIGVGEKLKLVEIKKGKVVKELVRLKGPLITIKKTVHPKYGECLLFNSLDDTKIFLWTIKVSYSI